jgi:hypothetical protein
MLMAETRVGKKFFAKRGIEENKTVPMQQNQL